MKEHVLAESVKAALNGKKVIAALFLTYNFDAAFFENYILPLCMDPNLNFGSNAAQNTMLWIRHGNDLPPVTVVCDYYAKNNSEAPRLNYDVVCIALKNNCFHPKNIFLLCDDEELLLFTGSANISYSGWCHNTESMSMIKFRSSTRQDAMAGKMREYLENITRLASEHTGTSERSNAVNKILRYFVNARVHVPKGISFDFYNSMTGEFSHFLAMMQDTYNYGKAFNTVEIVSPYFSPHSSAKQYDGLAAMCESEIDLAMPWSKPGQAGITKMLYESLPDKGFRWRVPAFCANDDQFRFTHGKIYRFKGIDKAITVVGSVNFTEKGFARFGKKSTEFGNIESALAIIEPVERWGSIFNDHSPVPDYFVANDEMELELNERLDVPPLFFTLDWGESTLSYSFQCEDKWGDTCRLQLPHRTSKPILRYPQGTIALTQEELEYFSDSCVITIQESMSKNIHYYFPKHVNFQAKPVPPKLRFSIPEIFHLWESLGADSNEREIAGTIEQVCAARINENGEIEEEDTSGFSSLNLMAQHLSGIDYLHRFIFSKDDTVSNDCPANERTRLLFSDGLDTLPHYCRQLARFAQEERGKERLPLGFYWLVLSIIKKKFYIESHSRLKSDMAENQSFIAWLTDEIKSTRKVLERKRGVEHKLLAWAEKNI